MKGSMCSNSQCSLSEPTVSILQGPNSMATGFSQNPYNLPRSSHLPSGLIPSHYDILPMHHSPTHTTPPLPQRAPGHSPRHTSSPPPPPPPESPWSKPQTHLHTTPSTSPREPQLPALEGRKVLGSPPFHRATKPRATLPPGHQAPGASPDIVTMFF
ncbi:extensin-like [Coregonus clupeaformis]|uniref:extensin-like n=1 Tax=Coregonus clupeaformis TaxID=59861 RepID=UPI001E1C4100|nr:extensin-like [Coregonus clupeaformis]